MRVDVFGIGHQARETEATSSMAQDHIVVCACGQWNRMKDQRRKRGWFSCAKCGRQLEIPASTMPRRSARWIGWGLFLVVAVGGMASIYSAKPPGRQTPGRQISNPTLQPTLPAIPAIAQLPGPAPFAPEPTWIEATRPASNLGRPVLAEAVPDSGRRAQSPRDRVAQQTAPQAPKLSPIPARNGVLRQRKGGGHCRTEDRDAVIGRLCSETRQYPRRQGTNADLRPSRFNL